MHTHTDALIVTFAILAHAFLVRRKVEDRWDANARLAVLMLIALVGLIVLAR